ncbi:MAG TPA: cytochrome c [Acidimicrobiia bacterium]|jgi:mono/diheme cytochrome c family protein
MSRDARRAASPVVLLLLATAAASLSLGACGGDGAAKRKPQPPALTGMQAGDRQLVQGRAVYGKYCAECHGVRGEGGTGPELAGGRTTKDFVTPAQQADVVEHGRNTMPGFQGILSRNQIDAVVRYQREAL